MSVFEYIAVMVTVVLGLGVAHLLASLGSLVGSRGRIRAHWVQLLWFLLLLGLHLQAWLSLWLLRDLSEWRIGQIVAALLASGLIVIAARIFVPDLHADTEMDLRERYFQVHGRFFSALAVFWIIPLAGRVVLFEGDLWAREAAFQVSWLALSISGALIARSGWHAALVLIWSALLVAFLAIARGPLSGAAPAG